MGMTSFGNRTWQDAFPNNQKALYSLSMTAFSALRTEFDKHGINYYAYERNGTVTMAMNANDVRYLPNILAEELRSEMVSVTTSKENQTEIIFSNVSYHTIPEKTFFQTDIDVALKIADQLKTNDVPFSSRIYNGYAVITVSKENLPELHRINDEVLWQRSQHLHHIDKFWTMETASASSMKNARRITSSDDSAFFMSVSDILTVSGIEFTAKIQENRSTILIAEKDVETYQAIRESISGKQEILNQLRNAGFSEHQLQILNRSIGRMAFFVSNESYLQYVHPSATDDELRQMNRYLCDYAALDSLDRYGVTPPFVDEMTDYAQELYQRYGELQQSQPEISIEPEIVPHMAQSEPEDVFGIVEPVVTTPVEDVPHMAQSESLEAVSAENVPHMAQSDDAKIADQSVVEEPVLTMPNAERLNRVSSDFYDLYQIKSGEATRDLRFISYDELIQMGKTVKLSNYNLIYSGKLGVDTTLDMIYEQLNVNHPSDYRGCSMSMSDIIVMHRNGETVAYYVDRNGFVDVTAQLMQKLSAEKGTLQSDLDLPALFDEYIAAQSETVKFEHISGERREQLMQQYWKETEADDALDWRDQLMPLEYELVATFDEFVAIGVDVLDDQFRAVVQAKKAEANAPFDAIAINYWGETAAPDISKHLLNAENSVYSMEKVPAKKSKTGKIIAEIYNGYLGQDAFFSAYVDLIRLRVLESSVVTNAALNSGEQETKIEIRNRLQIVVADLLIVSAKQHGAFYNAFCQSAHLRERLEAVIYQDAMHLKDVPHMAQSESKDIVDAESNLEELSEGAQRFLTEDIARLLVESVLAYDEMEEIGVWLYGGIENLKASDNANYGGWLNETTLAVLAQASREGKSIDQELVRGIFTSMYGTAYNTVSFEWEKSDGIYTGSQVIPELTDYGVRFNYTDIFQQTPCQREFSYETLGKILRELVKEEYDQNYGEKEEQISTPVENVPHMAQSEPLEAVSAEPVETTPVENVPHMAQSEPLEAVSAEPVVTTPVEDVPHMAQSKSSKSIFIKPIVETSTKSVPHMAQSEPEDGIRTIKPQAALATDESVTNFHYFWRTENSSGQFQFSENLEAIKTLKMLEKEERPATRQEQHTLAEYGGWGGLAEKAFGTSGTMTARQTELKNLLTPEEYAAARASTLDSFYTPTDVAKAMFKALEGMGMESGRILEPSAGIGRFIGCMPASLQDSDVYAVEVDSISARIARQLYPHASVTNAPFEQVQFNRGAFDAVIGNVPFGDAAFVDKQYPSKGKIHDYFFMRSLDLVKEGGVVAFITSTGTLDKKDESVRMYLAEQADLLGAIRLPNNTFGDTKTSTDIVFLRKRSEPPEEMPDWVHTGELPNGISVNQYFVDNPRMILGNMEATTHFNQTTCRPKPAVTLDVQLDDAIDILVAQNSGALEQSTALVSETVMRVEMDERFADLHHGQYGRVDGKVYFRDYSDNVTEWNGGSIQKGGSKLQQKANNTAILNDMMELADLFQQVVDAQMQEQPDSVLLPLQAKLNESYDRFYATHGLLHEAKNRDVFQADERLHKVLSLEAKPSLDEKTGLPVKADLFTKRTINAHHTIDHVDSLTDALLLSVQTRNRVDFEYMEQMTGISREEIIAGLQGQVFPIPTDDGQVKDYAVRDDYLSGNIRKKIAAAQEAAVLNPLFAGNVTALEEVLPPKLKAGDISIQIGATWLDPKYIQQFMAEVMGVDQAPKAIPANGKEWEVRSILHKNKRAVWVEYEPKSEKWSINGKKYVKDNPLVKEKFGTSDASGLDILENLLNLRQPHTVVKIGEEVDSAATEMANTALAQKAQVIRDAFANWIFRDPERREAIVEQYNNLFNSIVPRHFDGDALVNPTLGGDVELRSHQKDAIAHALYGENTLFAHAVGAGKTYEMIVTAMEGKRLGLHDKPLLCVPKHIVEQVTADFMKLYPEANVLTLLPSDFSIANRRELFARIMSGNYDAIIMSHSQLSKVELSKERQLCVMNEQMIEILEALIASREDGTNPFTVKQLEALKKALQKKMDELRNKPRDSGYTFEELGIDKLIVDEAHEFKNLSTHTKLGNIGGISTTGSAKAYDLYFKCRYMDEITGGKGIVFATGTPISNSVTELHTMMRYLYHEQLSECGMATFDSFISQFGQFKTDWELSPTGTTWRQRTRIEKYNNISELQTMFHSFADVRTADMLNLDVPECSLHIVEAQPTALQEEMLIELSDRADAIHSGAIARTEDNMLSVTGDGRKAGLDVRLVNPEFPDSPQTKVNLCVENVFRIWNNTSDQRLSQLIFCDLGVPQAKPASKKKKKNAENDTETAEDASSVAEQESLEEVGKFCVYDDIKEKLIAKGIPADEIAFIHDADTIEEKERLFESVRRGDIRVLIGSTAKMGTGTNCQDRLIAQHDLDVPWRPADLEQRRGRMVRQGNNNDHVDLYRYITKGMFDAYSYQLLEQKQGYISQIMKGDMTQRTCEEVDKQALEYSEVKALCTKDPRIKERLTLETEVKLLNLSKQIHQNATYDAQDAVRSLPVKIRRAEMRLEQVQQDIENASGIEPVLVDKPLSIPFEMNGNAYTDVRQATTNLAAELAKASMSYNLNTDVPVGKIGSFKITVQQTSFTQNLTACIHGKAEYYVDLTGKASTDLRRIFSMLGKLPLKAEDLEQDIAQMKEEMALATEKANIPFEQESELQQKSERLAVLTQELFEEERQNTGVKKHERTHYFDGQMPDASLSLFDMLPMAAGMEEGTAIEATAATPSITVAERQSFLAIQDIAPELLNEKGGYIQKTGECYDALNLEALPNSDGMLVMCLGTSFVQNGDLMRSPEFVFLVDKNAQTAQLLSYQDDAVGIYTEFSCNDRERQDALSFFLGTWHPAMMEQKRELTKGAFFVQNGDSETCLEIEKGVITNAKSKDGTPQEQFLADFQRVHPNLSVSPSLLERMQQGQKRNATESSHTQEPATHANAATFRR